MARAVAHLLADGRPLNRLRCEPLLPVVAPACARSAACCARPCLADLRCEALLPSGWPSPRLPSRLFVHQSPAATACTPGRACSLGLSRELLHGAAFWRKRLAS